MSKHEKGYNKLPAWAKKALDNGGGADVGAYLSQQGDVDSATLSPGLGLRRMQSGLVVVSQGISFRQGSSLQYEEQPFPQGMGPLAGANGQVYPTYLNTEGIAMIQAATLDPRGFAAGQKQTNFMLAQTYHPLSSSNAITYGNQALRLSLVYVPYRAQCSGVAWITSAVASAYTPSNVNGFAIYQPSGSVVSGSVTFTKLISAVALGPNINTLGYGTANWASPGTIMLEPGPYYIGVLTSWSAITGSITPVSAQLGDGGATFVAKNHWSNYSLSCRLNSQTSFPASFTDANVNYADASNIVYSCLLGANNI